MRVAGAGEDLVIEAIFNFVATILWAVVALVVGILSAIF